MLKKVFLLGAVALSGVMAAAPANAALLLFDLSGSRNASFTLDSNPIPTTFSSSSLIGDQISFSNVAGTYNGIPGLATIGFGNGLAATLNIGNANLGFTQFVGPDLFSGTAANPVFSPGTFSLRSIVSGNSTLRISQVAAAVPEPGTWAMMLIGFGAVGYSMRRRKVAVTYA